MMHLHGAEQTPTLSVVAQKTKKGTKQRANPYPQAKEAIQQAKKTKLKPRSEEQKRKLRKVARAQKKKQVVCNLKKQLRRAFIANNGIKQLEEENKKKAEQISKLRSENRELILGQAIQTVINKSLEKQLQQHVKTTPPAVHTVTNKVLEKQPSQTEQELNLAKLQITFLEQQLKNVQNANAPQQINMDTTGDVGPTPTFDSAQAQPTANPFEPNSLFN